ncbi:TPA: hypothetical protein ACH9YK_005084, partial [Escherichia coli]
GNALNRKIFINSENPRGRRPVACRIAGKDPQALWFILNKFNILQTSVVRPRSHSNESTSCMLAQRSSPSGYGHG